jgi:hypothetical protein
LETRPDRLAVKIIVEIHDELPACAKRHVKENSGVGKQLFPYAKASASLPDCTALAMHRSRYWPLNVPDEKTKAVFYFWKTRKIFRSGS